jgi:hypothetical protein
MSDIKPIHAREGDSIDVHWHCEDGTYIERLTCPPKATRDARRKEHGIVELDKRFIEGDSKFEGVSKGITGS